PMLRPRILRLLFGRGFIEPVRHQPERKPMFKNLKLTWPREPILYLALILAIGNVVYAALAGGIEGQDAVESVIALIFGFVGRGQVSPV
ncbi:MAG TPA: hypothetical protein VJA46_11365, partial [Acidimicrobiia bacterium]|nr:hypothetical protein [Acidimicrobiia bacterium]